MATGTEVINDMPMDSAFKSNSTTNLAAVNAAIRSSWPMWRMTEYAQGGTLAASTYEYSLSALTTIDPATGVAAVFVIPANSYQRDISHRCRQYYSHTDSAWTLVVAPEVITRYATSPFYVEYQYPHPVITALTDTVYAPVRALAVSALLWLSMEGASELNLDNSFLRAFAPEYLRSPSAVWGAYKSQHIQHRVPLGRGHI